jgi:Trk K+ transport system NAD-binding subunit
VVIVGTEPQLRALTSLGSGDPSEDLVLILGYGSVGMSAADFLQQHEVPYRVVEKDPGRAAGVGGLIAGDAGRQEVLQAAGIAEAHGLIVTTHDDGMNVFLTLVGRHLNPSLRIVARANREENVSELYAAGADFVVSLVSVGANMLTNALEGKESTFLTEGVQIFWQPVPSSLRGRRLQETDLRRRTGATVVGVRRAPGSPLVQADRDLVFEPGMQLLLVGSPRAEERFSSLLRGGPGR